MIPLNIETKKNFVNMSYKNDSDYFKIHDDLEDEFYNQFNDETKRVLLMNPKEKQSTL